jgi:hypothetical protein
MTQTARHDLALKVRKFAQMAADVVRAQVPGARKPRFV